MKVIERGYYTLRWGGNSKKMHFSRLFGIELKKAVNKSLTDWGKELTVLENMEDGEEKKRKQISYLMLTLIYVKLDSELMI